MKQTNNSFVVRWMPSFTDLAFLMPLVFMFTRLDGAPGMLGDGDTGWHIRAGEWMLANGSVPRQDIFSFTMPGQPWYAWEWLWDVAFAWLHQMAGMPAVVLGSMVVICLSFGLLFRAAYKSCGHPFVAIGLTVLAAAASTIHWLARPHLFTMLFVVLAMMLIRAAREARPKLLLWLPVLTVLWANLHGGFLALVIILGAYAAGDAVSALLTPDSTERRLFTKQAGMFGATAVACLAASLVNPYGYQLHVHIWEYLTDPGMTRAIVEFQGTNFQGAASGYLEALLVIGVGAAVWHGRHNRFAEVVLLVVWGHLALLMARNVPLFGLVCVPLLAPAVTAWLSALESAHVATWVRRVAFELRDIGEEFGSLELVPRFHAISVAAVAVVAMVMMKPEPSKLWKSEYDQKSYPAAALAMLHPSRHVFTNDEWGDYLIYRLGPAGLKVYIDGRSDFYGSKFAKEYLDVIRGRYNWETIFARYGVDTVLLPANNGLATTIKQSSNWRVTYDDGTAIVFEKGSSFGVPAEPTGSYATGVQMKSSESEAEPL